MPTLNDRAVAAVWVATRLVLRYHEKHGAEDPDPFEIAGVLLLIMAAQLRADREWVETLLTDLADQIPPRLDLRRLLDQELALVVAEKESE